ncbi:MAG: hypothetical protein ACREQO_03355 [Candidatus Binatia bacterium]
MISKQYIGPSLQALDTAYKNAASADDAERFAKLAIIELCGWIEETLDALVLRCATRHLKVQKNLSYCKDDIIGKTYGFDYHRHFRWMLIRLVGLVSVERLEQQVDQIKHETLKSTLGSLRVARDSVAHTHLKGTTRGLDAPSMTISRYQVVYDGLMDIDRTMRMAGW